MTLSKKSLVVHGPFNIGRCGGAGRYGQQLYKQLNIIDKKDAQASYDMFFLGAEESFCDS